MTIYQLPEENIYFVWQYNRPFSFQILAVNNLIVKKHELKASLWPTEITLIQKFCKEMKYKSFVISFVWYVFTHSNMLMTFFSLFFVVFCWEIKGDLNNFSELEASNVAWKSCKIWMSYIYWQCWCNEQDYILNLVKEREKGISFSKTQSYPNICMLRF